jgi:hypothetical protein
VATCVSGCGVYTECRVATQSPAARHSVHTPQLETHVATTLQTFNDVFLLINSTKCNFIKARRKLPEDGPDGPKHVGANMEIF